MASSFQFSSVQVQHPQGQPAQKATPCCHQCGQKAHFFVSSVGAQGQVAQKAFCLPHALHAGLMHPKAWDLLGAATPAQPAAAVLSCACGMTEKLIKAKGRAGCPQCYRVFASLFSGVVARVQFAPVHAGKAPRRRRSRVVVRARVEALQAALAQAIRTEAYEEAARVRDELSALQATR